MKLFGDVHRMRTITSIVVIGIASAAAGGVKTKTATGSAGTRHPTIAGAEQMRRQGQAVQPVRSRQPACG